MTNAEPPETLLCAFLEGTIDAKTFHHRDHLAVAFEILKRHDFADGAAIYCAALKTIASRAGNPSAFHVTTTLAFLSLVAERCTEAGYTNFDAFIDDNPDLLAKSAIERFYSQNRLLSEVARKTFILPDAVR